VIDRRDSCPANWRRFASIPPAAFLEADAMITAGPADEPDALRLASSLPIRDAIERGVYRWERVSEDVINALRGICTSCCARRRVDVPSGGGA
jgi:hypothetical protein